MTLTVMRSTGPGRMTLYWLLMILACSYVLLINGAPLYYFDTGGYIDNGLKVLRQLGINPGAPADPPRAGGSEALGDGTVNASRSVFYSLFAAALTLLVSPYAVPVAHAIVIIGTALLAGKIIADAHDLPLRGTALATAGLVAAALGSLPFYVAYLMPDIFTGVLIIVVGLLAAYARCMNRAQLAAAVILGVIAVIFHPSHLVIAAGLLLFVLFVAVVLRGPRWALAPVLVGLIVLGGAAERKAFSVAAEVTLDAEAVNYPFLTARLIQDDVGVRYLKENCPAEGLATCALLDELERIDEPMRYTASHILFEKHPRLGSLRLLPSDIQQRIAREQVAFAIDTALAHPVLTTRAILKNTWRQARMFSVRMTVPEPKIVANLRNVRTVPEDIIIDGRIEKNRDWIASVDAAHTLVYAASVLVLLYLLLRPGALPGPARVFLVVVAAGILANAFVCGAVSQPAHRYGARAAWLLPYSTGMLAALSVMLARRRERGHAIV